MLASEYNFCQICSSSQNSIFAENTLKRVFKIWKKIQEFILTIKETTYVKMKDFWNHCYFKYVKSAWF